MRATTTWVNSYCLPISRQSRSCQSRQLPHVSLQPRQSPLVSCYTSAASHAGHVSCHMSAFSHVSHHTSVATRQLPVTSASRHVSGQWRQLTDTSDVIRQPPRFSRHTSITSSQRPQLKRHKSAATSHRPQDRRHKSTATSQSPHVRHNKSTATSQPPHVSRQQGNAARLHYQIKNYIRLRK